MEVRQLEFTVLQLTQQIHELLAATQSILQGKLPIDLRNPTMLHNIWWNVSLNLPENYELVAGTSSENIHLYYNLKYWGQGKVKRPGTGKCSSEHFTLHKLIVLPTRILENKFIAYEHDYDYLALSFNQRDFALLKEDDLKSCSTGTLAVCPINVPLYDAKVLACEAELFFQMSGETPACRKKLLLRHSTPTMHRHGIMWFYHFSEQRQVYAVQRDLAG